MKLPVKYADLTWEERRMVRGKYREIQEDKCLYCNSSLKNQAPKKILDKKIDWSLFPDNFLKYPVHLQHNHKTGMTEGAVHNYCNAVMWQYHNR